MPLPPLLQHRLSLPAVAAPMFLASGPELVLASCRAGVLGSFPALNARTSEILDQWLTQINQQYDPAKDAPYAVNLIAHRTNPRLQTDLALCVKHRVPVIITSLGAMPEIIEAVHEYGGLVFHDVINVRHGRKAARAGVDGLIAVCNGAGGHGGTLNPLAFVGELRQFFDKTLLVGGCISTGADIAAVQAMGADLAYMGTRFLASQECQVVNPYKQMVVESACEDIFYTPHISGVHANFLRPSLEQAGLDPDNLEAPEGIDFGQELTDTGEAGKGEKQGEKKKGAWVDYWTAGQGVGNIQQVLPTAKLVKQLKQEYLAAVERMQGLGRCYKD